MNSNSISGVLSINHTAEISIGTTSLGTTIGQSGQTTTINGTVTIGNPIIPGYGYNDTTGISNTTGIGYILVGTGTLAVSVNAVRVIRSITSLTVGVWLLIGSVWFSGASTWVSTSISSTNVHDFSSGNITGAAGANNAHTCTRIVVITTGTATYNLVCNSNNNNCTLSSVKFQALRIA